MPKPDSKEGGEGDVDKLADSAWWDAAYGRGGKGEDGGDQSGDGC